MNSNPTSVDVDISFKNLTEATQLLVAEADEIHMITIALKILAYYTHSNRVELWLLTKDNKTVRFAGLLSDDKVTMPNHLVSIAETPIQKIMDSRVAAIYSEEGEAERYYVPLIGTKNLVKGIVIINLPLDAQLSVTELQTINILSELVSVSLERIQYFQLAVYDVLTGLYVRRQFDIRILEETARVKRYGGSLGIMIADIDYFKHFNDTYGHQQGDMILHDIAAILLKTVREDVDIPCRYGGEEFATIMPNTDIKGVITAAERFRLKCARYTFPGQSESDRVTVSIGAASMEGDSEVSSQEFFRRADAMLYKAKETGRNKVFS